MKCSFPGCSSSAPDGKTMCFLHGRLYGNITIKPTGKNDQRAEDEKLYRKTKAVFLKDRIFCQVKGCTKKSADVHHKKGRIGKLLYDVTNFLAVCRPCHKKIEANPQWARQEGYSVSRLAK